MSRDLIKENQRTKQLVGPLKYQAPEQLNHQIVSKESDVFSFGVLITV